MSDRPDSSHSSFNPAESLSDLPHDELLRYGRELGLDLDAAMDSAEIVRRIRLRRELLVELDREAMLDVVVWGRRPVRKSAGKEHLAREIARIQRTGYEELSTRGLVVLAKLRGLATKPGDTADELIDAIRESDGVWKRITEKRRKWIGSVLSRVIEGKKSDESEAYRFLPEEGSPLSDAQKTSLKSQVETHGIVGGIAQRLRGAADDYIQIKLDEIEARIDAKLDQIDRRLGEWRDREVANRLRILKITLGFTVLVAILSLGYNYAKRHVEPSRRSDPQTIDLIIP